MLHGHALLMQRNLSLTRVKAIDSLLFSQRWILLKRFLIATYSQIYEWIQLILVSIASLYQQLNLALRLWRGKPESCVPFSIFTHIREFRLRQTLDSCVTQKRENLRFLTCLNLLRSYAIYLVNRQEKSVIKSRFSMFWKKGNFILQLAVCRKRHA